MYVVEFLRPKYLLMNLIIVLNEVGGEYGWNIFNWSALNLYCWELYFDQKLSVHKSHHKCGIKVTNYPFY